MHDSHRNLILGLNTFKPSFRNIRLTPSLRELFREISQNGKKGIDYAGTKRTGNQTSDMEKEEQTCTWDQMGYEERREMSKIFGSFRQWVIGGLASGCFLYVLESCMMRWFRSKGPNLFPVWHYLLLAVCP